MLNVTELKVLNAVRIGIIHQTYSEFCYADDVVVDDLSVNQIKGYLSQLSQKGFIYIDDEFGQITLRKASIGFSGIFEGDFELYD